MYVENAQSHSLSPKAYSLTMNCIYASDESLYEGELLKYSGVVFMGEESWERERERIKMKKGERAIIGELADVWAWRLLGSLNLHCNEIEVLQRKLSQK